VSPAALQIELQNLMWELAGPFRTGDNLTAALTRINHMRDHELEHAAIGAEKSFNLDLQDWFELSAMLTTAEAVVASALARAESRGAHQREDFPQSADAFVKNQVLELREGKLTSSWTEPVRLHQGGGSDG
jgi:succinate dehydrogenase/fumarate reductase flavoprotein subunit